MEVFTRFCEHFHDFTRTDVDTVGIHLCAISNLEVVESQLGNILEAEIICHFSYDTVLCI